MLCKAQPAGPCAAVLGTADLVSRGRRQTQHPICFDDTGRVKDTTAADLLFKNTQRKSRRAVAFSGKIYYLESRRAQKGGLKR